MTTPPREKLILPFLAPFYHTFAQPFGWLAFRAVVGIPLIMHGWPKILDPLSQTGFVESLGFHPGWLFSPTLAALQFVGGILIVLGLLTRPVALANTVMLLVTVWFHYANPYGGAVITPDGVAFLKDNLQYLTDVGQSRLLGYGGEAFFTSAQRTIMELCITWTGATALIAAYGGGRISLDRMLGKEF